MQRSLYGLTISWLCLLVACGGDGTALSDAGRAGNGNNENTEGPAPEASTDAHGEHHLDSGVVRDSAAGSRADAATDAQTGGSGGAEELIRGSQVALSVPLAEDRNPDPDVIEIVLHAMVADVDIGSRKVKMYTFNGQVPGPRIEAKVGDKLIVHFTNHLPVETMIHWHGVRVPNGMDGTPLVQSGVATGATFDYEFTLTDPGIYWYHPHLDSSEQLMRGLYGPIIVRDPSEPENLGDELTLVLSDVTFSSQGVAGFPDPSPALQVEGRDGAVVLINGKEPRTLLAQPGARLRLRVLNAASNRFFKLQLTGHKLTRVGAEAGLSAAATDVFSLLVANAERADLVVVPNGKAGDRIDLVALPYDRGTGGEADKRVLLTLQLVGDPAEAPDALPAKLRDIAPLSATGAEDVSVKIERMDNHYTINGAMHDAVPAVVGHVGAVQHWNVANVTYFDHPFHLHGFFFQVLDPNTNEPVTPLEWRDTVNIPQSGKLELLVKYDDRPGAWMYHCHVLDHVETGLMGLLNVE